MAFGLFFCGLGYGLEDVAGLGVDLDRHYSAGSGDFHFIDRLAMFHFELGRKGLAAHMLLGGVDGLSQANAGLLECGDLLPVFLCLAIRLAGVNDPRTRKRQGTQCCDNPLFIKHNQLLSAIWQSMIALPDPLSSSRPLKERLRRSLQDCLCSG